MDNSFKMMKRPKRGETEEDILQMQAEFLAEKNKNPKLKSAAQFVKIEKAPKKSLFAQSRAQKRTATTETSPVTTTETSTTTMTASAATSMDVDNTTALILGEIHEKIVGDVVQRSQQQTQSSMPNIIVGDIKEHFYTAPKEVKLESEVALPFPKIERSNLKSQSGKSIFASSFASKASKATNAVLPMETEVEEKKARDFTNLFGAQSAIIIDENTAREVHNENLQLLSKMNESEILAERQKLLNSIDPTLVALLAKKRKEKLYKQMTNESSSGNAKAVESKGSAFSVDTEVMTNLTDSNAAVEILNQSGAENWLHFDVVEQHKLEWMRDIPAEAAKLKPGEQFEARFDWKGVLLPYSTETIKSKKQIVVNEAIKDERELYLHGSEPHRPGYTLQELFRLARSNVIQQRISAFGALAGILNIFNQGFYDKVLDLPITKIFFLLRFGLDDNTPAMVEIVSRALAFLCYNETDETLLDFIYDNPGCHWQPVLQIIETDSIDDDDPTSIKNLQMQMDHLRMNSSSGRSNINANVDESEEESRTSMSDFQLAETDLIDCMLRTNILQRIYFILSTLKVDNTTVASCLRLLIRIARTSKESAMQITNHESLINCLFKHFIPGLEHIDTIQSTTTFYNFPQYLCLKLFRVLISQNLGIAVKFVNLGLVEKLQNYIFCANDIRGKIIRVQIEALRILRCLLLLHVENFLYRRFLPAFRFMLEWHFNHSTYEVGGANLLRQHAAALLGAISSYTAGSGSTSEITSLLSELIHNCCCNWFHQAKRVGIQEFTQATLLSSALHTVTWYIHLCGSALDFPRLHTFIEKYLREFLASKQFDDFVNIMPSTASIVLRNSHDRRNVHPPLPNVGAVLMHHYGPQLIIPQNYPVHLLNAIWRLLDKLQCTEELNALKATILDVFIRPQIIEPLIEYVRGVGNKMNVYLATNFFARFELQLIFKLLCFDGISTYFTKAELLQIVYNFVCCLSAEQIPEIEQLFQRYIFNTEYLAIDNETLKKWRTICLELVYPHYIIVPPTELTLSVASTQVAVLPKDWPYFQLKTILQNYIENVQQKPTEIFSEREVLQMTFSFVTQLENCNANLEIVTPTEKLMYFMIAFMGPDSQFLEKTMRPLIEQELQKFYAQCRDYTFQFDGNFEGKCKFENLYALFVDHFQAASYGDELFSSLVLVPLAQKYDNKWRRRVWSDYASALRFLDCDERWLIGGIEAYLTPIEQDESLVRAYDVALRTNLLRTNTVPYRIAKHHVQKFKTN